jgi:hypothetical protein
MSIIFAEDWGKKRLQWGELREGRRNGGRRGIPPLRGPTRHNSARRRKSGRSGRNDKFGVVDEERGGLVDERGFEPTTFPVRTGTLSLTARSTPASLCRT